MQGCNPRMDAFSLLVALFALMPHFESIAADVAASSEAPGTWIDDAQLHDVKFVGSKRAMAAGEHGAIWTSDDGGRSWTGQKCGLDVSLRSVCLLDDQTGWIAGRDQVAYAGLDRGVLLSTRDGGKSWKRIAAETLPALNYVKFFGLDEGVVVGNPTSLSPSGIYKTSDGGQTWRGVQGEAPQGWKAICFLEPEMGVVAGANSRVSLMGGEQLFASKLLPQGFRSIRAISLLPSETGWLAGDGGLVLKTVGGGLIWDSPSTPLPEELREGMDFRAVDVRGENVWLAGSPGSVVWHSPDGGRRWVKQLTGQTAPLSAVRFANHQLGLAVGEFGVIIRTEDGGKTWQGVRGNGRHAAVLALHARPGQTSAALLTKLSGEAGYRSAVWIAQRNDLGPLAIASDSESRLNSAVQKSGGNAAEIHWQLPLTVPGLEYSSEKLLAEWQRQTEGRLSQTLLGGLVRQIRTWQPNIVVLDQPSPDDAASQLLFDAALRAVGQAADATRYTEQSEFTALSPWIVDRVYVRLAPGANGDAHVDLDEFLPHLKTSTRIAASSSIALLETGRVPLIESVETPRIAYRWLGLDGKPANESSTGSRNGTKTASRSRDFFGGLLIAPGSAARRDMGPIDEAQFERAQKLVQKQRNFNAISRKSLDDPRMAGQMLGQINNITDGMDSHQAAIVLRDLADEYRKRSQFELVESTYTELVHRYPNEPESLDAMRWLLQFWCSSETAWQRMRLMTSNTSMAKSKIDQRARYVQHAVGETILGDDGIQLAVGSDGDGDLIRSVSPGVPERLNAKLNLDATHSAGKSHSKTQTGTKPGRLAIAPDVDWRTGAANEWHARAIELAKRMESISPGLFRSPEIQFPLAALRRTNGSSRASDAIMRSFAANAIDSELKLLAERELWTSIVTTVPPQALAVCRSANERPHLDGLLSDGCWEDAKEIHLTEKSTTLVDGQSDASRSMVMFAYDEEFLYLAFRVPHAEGIPRENPQMRGRQHDADLSRYDRLSVRLDIDRDYTTWYEFQIDQRGWTAESCWEDRRWNPTWYVAAESDSTNWRIEAAIPWRDLTSNAPHRGTIYGVSILRTIPTVGLQSWVQPAISRPQPTSFGLLTFE